MHLQGHNYVEAALTLKLHADLHEWDLNSFVDPMPDLDLPRQSQFVRKETLCLLILDYLGEHSRVNPRSGLMSFYRKGESMGKRRGSLQGASVPAFGGDI